MSTSSKATSVKSEFTEVITMDNLMGTNTTNEFSPVITETDLIYETKPDEVNTLGLILKYDEIFPEPKDYYTFTEAKLEPWKNTLDFKYFDTMYTNYRLLTQSICHIREQAQKLLDEADTLQGRDFVMREEINKHVKRITRKEL